MTPASAACKPIVGMCRGKGFAYSKAASSPFIPRVHRPGIAARRVGKQPHVGGVVVPRSGIARLRMVSSAVESSAAGIDRDSANDERQGKPKRPRMRACRGRARASAQPEFCQNFAAGVQGATNALRRVGDPRCGVFVAGYAVELYVACWSAKPTGGNGSPVGGGAGDEPLHAQAELIVAYCLVLKTLPIVP